MWHSFKVIVPLHVPSSNVASTGCSTCLPTLGMLVVLDEGWGHVGYNSRKKGRVQVESKPRRETGLEDAVCILPSLVICPVTLGKYLNLAMLTFSHLENKNITPTYAEIKWGNGCKCIFTWPELTVCSREMLRSRDKVEGSQPYLEGFWVSEVKHWSGKHPVRKQAFLLFSLAQTHRSLGLFA